MPPKKFIYLDWKIALKGNIGPEQPSCAFIAFSVTVSRIGLLQQLNFKLVLCFEGPVLFPTHDPQFVRIPRETFDCGESMQCYQFCKFNPGRPGTTSATQA